MSSEAKLISAICKNKDIQSVLTSDVEGLFDTHKDIWQTLRDYYFKHRSVPDVSVLEEKHREFEPTRVDGDTAFYLDELRNDHINRGIKEFLFEEGSKHGKISGEELLQQMSARLSRLARHTNVVRDIDLTDVEGAKQDFERKKALAKERGGSPGILTGIKALDAHYPTGLAGGQMIVLIGWSGHGKTWFGSYLAAQAWANGAKPMIVSLEMSPEEIRDRIYTIMGSGLFQASRFNRGDIDIDEFEGWAKRELADKHKFIVVSNEGMGAVTPATVQAKIDQHRPDIVICDYHQLFDDDEGGGNEVTKNRNISKKFKRMAITNNIPIVDLSQATQNDPSDTQEPPRIEQVAWSKGIQHDADLALAVHKYEDSNLFTILARKNRHGHEFEFSLDWDINNGIIKEVYG